MKLNSVEELIEDIRLGKMVILMDDEDRENEGDLIMAAECCKPEDINFMATHARGLICLTLSEERCKQLNLPLMVDNNLAQHGTNFTLSIEAARGVTTGISAADRAQTVRAAVARGAVPDDIVQPGHIFPLRAMNGGVLSRAGHTEAGSDLAQLAGFEGASVIVEIMNDDGTMARRPDLEVFAEQHNLKIGTIADLIHYQYVNEKTIELVSKGPINTDYGEFILHTFRNKVDGDLHFALVKGDISAEDPTLVRVHLESTIRDLFCAQLPDRTTWNINRCLARVAQEGCGVVVLISHEESPAALQYSVDLVSGKSPAKLDDGGNHVYRSVGLGSQILREVGVGKMRVMGEPQKYNAISGFDLEVVEHIACE